jgi:hypothetical protein
MAYFAITSGSTLSRLTDIEVSTPLANVSR